MILLKNLGRDLAFVYIDRKDGGMIRTLKVLRNGEILAMLFDQNAGGAWYKASFYGKGMFMHYASRYIK